MNPVSVYETGLVTAFVLALLWSFVLDKNKPPTTKEFLAKLVARALLIAVLFVVGMGFLYLAFGVFRK